MRFITRLLLILVILGVRADLNDLWERFETNGSKINKTHLFIQYEKLCPILNGRNVWRENKDLKTQKGDCLIGKCNDNLFCQSGNNCCHRSPIGYLAASLFDPLVYPTEGSYIKYIQVDQCPYDNIDEIKQKCEHSGTSPVSSINTHVLYKNSFCAQCHGEYDTTKWKLVINCPDEYRTKPDTLLKDCFVRYMAQDPSLHQHLRDIYSFNQSSLISKCNETGLWEVYDKDVDWACRRFRRQYKQFKNLYCYLCNPSIISTQIGDNESLISTCNGIPEEHFEQSQTETFSETNATIPEMCTYSDIVPRLNPYKNAYCFICNEQNSEYLIDGNKGKFELRNFKDRSLLFEVTVSNDNKESLTSDTFRERIEHILKLFVKSKKKVKIPAENAEKENVKIIDKSMLIEGWSEMCPKDRVCTQPYESVKFWEFRFQCKSNCMCNKTCLLRRDLKCCFDQYVTHNAHTCLQESNFPVVIGDDLESSDDMKSHRVINTCILGNEDNNHRQKCQNDNQADLLMNIPVDSKNKRSTLPFRNIYCLLCNTVEPVDEVKVYLRVRCNEVFEIEILLTLKHIIEAIKTHQCKVSFALNDMLLRHHKCELDVQTIVKEKLDFVCLGESIVKGNGVDIDKLCGNSELPTVVKSLSREYVSCETCDRILDRKSAKINTVVQCRRQNDSTRTREHLCFVEDHSSLLISRSNSYYRIPNNYRSLFSINEIEFERLKHVDHKQCHQGTFDIKTGTCRRLYCSNDRTLENGVCVNVLESVVNTTFVTRLTLKLCKVYGNGKGIDSAGENLSNQPTNLNEDLKINIDNICKSIHKAVENISGNGTVYSHVECEVMVYNCETKVYFDNLSNVLNISDNTSIHVNIKVHVKTSNQKSRIESQLHSLSSKRLFRVKSVVLCPTKKPITKDSVLCRKQTFGIPNDTLQDEHEANFGLITIKKTLFCPLIKIKATNLFIDKTARNIRFNYYNTGFIVPLDSVDDIKTSNLTSTIWMCKDDLKLPGHINRNNKIDLQKVYFLFSTSCNVVSILSIILTLLTYSMFKVLRTVPGNNNMNLALCLLLAQASLQFPHVSQTLESEGRFIQCQAVGVGVHYFWLATFCALNICSFHMYKVFSGRLMLTRSQIKSVLPKYTLYVYGFPLFIIVTVVSVSMVTNGSIGYGIYRCFLDDLYSIIAAFLLPSCLIFISNVFFYGKTFYIIYDSPTLRSNIEERSTLIIYVKLCTLTGMTWPLLFIDALFPLSVFSFIATFINAMQGFFIFISFICNRRVLNLYRHSITGQQEPSTVSNNTYTMSRAQSLKRSS